jgi:hypothetical protein
MSCMRAVPIFALPFSVLELRMESARGPCACVVGGRPGRPTVIIVHQARRVQLQLQVLSNTLPS